RNDTGDESGTSHAPGIALANVSFQTTGTGSITLATGAGTNPPVDPTPAQLAPIRVLGLTTAGGAVSVTTRDGDIDVGAITTSGSGADGAAGSVDLRATRGSIDVADIEAKGGAATSAAPGAGGAGGKVSLSALAGSIAIGAIDASGGD